MQRLDLGGVRRWSIDLGAIAVLLAFSVLQCRSLLGALSSSVPADRFSGDTGQGVWYMAWLPFALGHSRRRFTHLQFAPACGFNLLSNTGMSFPALLLSPITVTAGPVAAFNVGLLLLLRLCPEGASISFAAASVSAGLRARSGASLWVLPYLMHEDPFGHFNLTWLFFPPLAYYLLRRILLDEGSASRQGLALGALVVVQYFDLDRDPLGLRDPCRADDVDLPGSPLPGRPSSAEAAAYCTLLRLSRGGSARLSALGDPRRSR